MKANRYVRVVDERFDIRRCEHAELVERAQRGDQSDWLDVLVGNHLAQPPRGAFFSALDQETLRRLAPPEKRAGAFAGQGPRTERAHVGRGSGRRVTVGEAMDAATVVAGINAVLLLEMTWDRGVVLDDFTIVIHDPNRTVRSVR